MRSQTAFPTHPTKRACPTPVACLSLGKTKTGSAGTHQKKYLIFPKSKQLLYGRIHVWCASPLKVWPRDECQSARVRDLELNFAAFLLEFERRLGPFFP